MDITSNIKMIEALKCELLSDLAALYESMRKPISPEDRSVPLTGMLIRLYLLARRLGLDFERLDEETVLRLRRETLDKGEDINAAERKALLKYLSKKA